MKVSDALRMYLDQYAKINSARTERQAAEEETMLEVYASILDDAIRELQT